MLASTLPADVAKFQTVFASVNGEFIREFAGALEEG
jgi:hypothetical protein